MSKNFSVENAGATGSIKASKNRPDMALSLIVASICIFFGTGCSHIALQPKDTDTQLLALEHYAREVSIHLLNTDPKTYEQYQHLLTQEITPGVLNKLKERRSCASSEAEIKSAIDSAIKDKHGCQVTIISSEFPARATDSGFVPIEVKLSVLNTKGDRKDLPVNFDLILLVGVNKHTNKPVITSIQFK